MCRAALPDGYADLPNPSALIAEAVQVCRPDGQTWTLNHLSGLRPVRLARWTSQDWQVVAVHSAKLPGLFRIVHVRKPG